MADDVKQVAPEARVGSVTFLEAGDATRRRERAVIALLGTIAALLTILVVGLSVGVFWLAKQYDTARQAVQAQAVDVRQDLSAAITTTQLLSRDMLVRQAALSRDLGASIGDIQSLQARLDAQRAAFGQIPKDPFGKADYAIRMTQLALDEAMAINRHVAAFQLAASKNLALTPAQQKLLQDLNRQLETKAK